MQVKANAEPTNTGGGGFVPLHALVYTMKNTKTMFKEQQQSLASGTPLILYYFAKPEYYFAAGRATFKRRHTHKRHGAHMPVPYLLASDT